MMNERALRGYRSLSGLHFFSQFREFISTIDLRFWVDFFGYIAKLSGQAGCFSTACFLIRVCFIKADIVGIYLILKD